ncbi:MAG: hypothetical protein Q8J64_00575 [Thermodesulfovibrionales bacterium]|nr:hypothetical protein [Thermodesulfovibrionales bacterium]
MKALLPLIGASAIFFLVVNAEVRNTDSDPAGSLHLSQLLIQHQTLRFDDHLLGMQGGLHIKEAANGHYYYYFPIGTSLFSAPLVCAANMLGEDMFQSDYKTQIAIAALLCAAVYLIIYATLRCYLAPWPSFAVSTVSFLGSSLMSTMGTALWSLNFTTLFTGIGLYMLALHDSGKTKTVNPYLLGAVLFSAYLCRPTASVFAACVVVYVFLRQRSAAYRLSAALSLLFVLFAVFSLFEYGKILPDYYSPGRLETGAFWTALYGNLLSPARGILIFSPFLVPVFFGAIVYFRELRSQGMFYLVSVWFVLHLATVSNFPHWWGGWSYGSRLLADALPGLILLTALLWRGISGAAAKKWITVACAAVFFVLGAAGIFINTAQGLYNPYAGQWWNTFPNINEHTERLFDWRYPQFLEGKRQLYMRTEGLLRVYESGISMISKGKPVALFPGHWDLGQGIPIIWDEGRRASVLFKAGDIPKRPGYALLIKAGSSRGQRVDIRINGAPLGGLIFGRSPEEKAVVFDGSLLIPMGMNEIEFSIPELKDAAQKEPKGYGFALALTDLRIIVPD